MIQVNSFINHVRNHLPVNSSPDVQATLRQRVEMGLEVFSRTEGDTVEARMEKMRSRGSELCHNGNTKMWASVGLLFGTLVLSAGFLATPLAPLAILAPWAISGTVSGVGFLETQRGGAKLEAANALDSYAKEFLIAS